MKTSHEFANILLNLPDLPIFVIGRWTGEAEEPVAGIDQCGWTEIEDGKRVWRVDRAIVIT